MKEIILKSNEITQKATFDLNEVELKCINYVVSLIEVDKTYTEQDYFEVSVKELADLIGLTGGSRYKRIREAFLSIGNKGRTIKLDDGVDLDLRFFLKVYGSEKGGAIRVSLMQEMLVFLQNLKSNFTMFELRHTLVLNSKYSIRLYEMCKSWQTKGYFVLYIDQIKDMWCIPESYRECDVKKLIDKCKVEISKKTDILVYTEREFRKGKNLMAIKLKIMKKNA